jgi:hypothetical protein
MQVDEVRCSPEVRCRTQSELLLWIYEADLQ